MPGQRAANAAEVVVPAQGQGASGGQAVCQLPQREGKEREGLPAAGVRDQRSRQTVLQAQPGHLRWLFDNVTQHLTIQRGQRIDLDRDPGQRRVLTQVIEELRPHCGDHLHRTSDCVPDQLRKSPQDGRRRPGEQLLGLVDRHQQPSLARAWPGSKQVVSHAP
jgi:hypothetical protein